MARVPIKSRSKYVQGHYDLFIDTELGCYVLKCRYCGREIHVFDRDRLYLFAKMHLLVNHHREVGRL